jgi:hypothetical protein
MPGPLHISDGHLNLDSGLNAAGQQEWQQHVSVRRVLPGILAGILRIGHLLLAHFSMHIAS